MRGDEDRQAGHRAAFPRNISAVLTGMASDAASVKARAVLRSARLLWCRRRVYRTRVSDGSDDAGADGGGRAAGGLGGGDFVRRQIRRGTRTRDLRDEVQGLKEAWTVERDALAQRPRPRRHWRASRSMSPCARIAGLGDDQGPAARIVQGGGAGDRRAALVQVAGGPQARNRRGARRRRTPDQAVATELQARRSRP